MVQAAWINAMAMHVLDFEPMWSPPTHAISPTVPVAFALDGKFSLQYTAAAALLDGAVTIDTFVDERRFRADMVALLGKTTLVQDASIAGDFHDMRVELDDGRRLAAVCCGPQGSWGVPLARGDHRAKLRGTASDARCRQRGSMNCSTRWIASSNRMQRAWQRSWR